jgi:hypothetical protein
MYTACLLEMLVLVNKVVDEKDNWRNGLEEEEEKNQI